VRNDAVVWIRQDNHAPPRLILHLRNMIDGVVERLDQWSRLEAAIPMHDFTDTAPDAMTAQPMSFLTGVSAATCVRLRLAHQVKSFEPMSLF